MQRGRETQCAYHTQLVIIESSRLGTVIEPEDQINRIPTEEGRFRDRVFLFLFSIIISL